MLCHVTTMHYYLIYMSHKEMAFLEGRLFLANQSYLKNFQRLKKAGPQKIPFGIYKPGIIILSVF